MLNEVRKILASQLNISIDTITADSRLVNDLQADSLDLVELITGLEERYGLEIPEEDVTKIQTVGDIVAYIESKQ